MRAVNLFLLIIALLVLMIAAIPPPPTCFIPPGAPTRGVYEKCWTVEEIVI